jgi:hypothetical protein
MIKKNDPSPTTGAKSVAKKTSKATGEGAAPKPASNSVTKKGAKAIDPTAALSGSRMERLHWLRRRALEQHLAASTSQSWIASRQFLQDVAKLDEQLHQEELAVQAASALDAAAADEEKFRELLLEQAGRMHVSHLEVFVKAYLDRHPGLRLEGGVDR